MATSKAFNGNETLPPIGGVHTENVHNRHSTPTRRNLVPRTTSVGLGANSTTLPIFQTEGVSVDEKLSEQFRYFRTEYVEAANTSGVAVPLVIVEDKSGQVYKFVYHGGPKYLFEVIQANLENIHLLRCSLSLLIIIITLLRRKLPDNASAPHKDSALFSVNTSDSITAWVADTLAKIGDASAVSICINVLITSYNPSVQELSLSLLASMLMVSDEAVAQMLLPYSSSGTAPVVDTANEAARKNSNRRSNLNSRPSSVEAIDNSLSQAAAGDIHKPAHLQTHKPKAVDFKKLNLNFSYNTMDYSAKKMHHVAKQPSRRADKANTCLSYVLSVILLQKNRHLLAAGCADIVLAMLRKNRRDMSEAIAQTPTCELPAIDDRKSKNEARSSFSKFSAQPEESTAPTSNPLSTVVIEWAGLKLLLKFIFRYEKMNAQSRTATTKAIDREAVSASLHLKEEYAYAHGRVFTAVCQLIASSPTVAAHANTLDGAEDLLTFTFSRVDPNDGQMYSTYVGAMNALALDKQLQARRRAHQLAMQRSGGRIPMDADIRLSDYMGSEGAQGEYGDQQHQQQHRPAQEARPVTPKELYNRLHARGGPGGSVSPSKSTQGGYSSKRSGGKHGGKTGGGAMQVSASADARLGSLPRTQMLSDSVELGRNIKVNFQAEYSVETEKRELYLLNSYDAKYGSGSSNNNTMGLKALSRQADHQTAQTPLSYHPGDDTLIGSSLEAIGATALRPITNPRPQMTEQQRKEAEFLLGGGGGSSSLLSAPSGTQAYTNSTGGMPAAAASPSRLHHHAASVASSQDSSSYPGRGRGRTEDEEVIFANSQDFFGSLPAQPAIPLRIEPKDVITEMEDLTVIRKKFQALAETAKRKANGKIEGPRDSQQELIRRVYGPRKFKYHDPKAPGPQYDEDGNLLSPQAHRAGNNNHSPSRSPSARARGEGTGGGGGIAPIASEVDYFASFSDASGTALQDLPIQPGGPKSSLGGGGLESMQGLEGMDFSVDHLAHFTHQQSQKQQQNQQQHKLQQHGSSASLTLSEGPDVYGLRLENFDFDEQHLFDGFKPLFSAPEPAPDRENKSDSSSASARAKAGPDQAVLDELGIGRKNKPDLVMAQTVDLILS